MSLNDKISNALVALGHSPDINDGMLQWAKANGATSDSLSDAILEALQSNGATSGDINDAWGESLAFLGHSGSINDKKRGFWDAGGSFASVLMDDGFDVSADTNLQNYTRYGLVWTKVGTGTLSILDANDYIKPAVGTGNTYWQYDFDIGRNPTKHTVQVRNTASATTGNAQRIFYNWHMTGAYAGMMLYCADNAVNDTINAELLEWDGVKFVVRATASITDASEPLKTAHTWTITESGGKTTVECSFDSGLNMTWNSVFSSPSSSISLQNWYDVGGGQVVSTRDEFIEYLNIKLEAPSVANKLAYIPCDDPTTQYWVTTGLSGTFQAGESVTITGGITGTFVSQNGANIVFRNVTGGTPAASNTITGDTSGATATLSGTAYAAIYETVNGWSWTPAAGTYTGINFRMNQQSSVYAPEGAALQKPRTKSCILCIVADTTKIAGPSNGQKMFSWGKPEDEKHLRLWTDRAQHRTETQPASGFDDAYGCVTPIETYPDAQLGAGVVVHAIVVDRNAGKVQRWVDGVNKDAGENIASAMADQDNCTKLAMGISTADTQFLGVSLHTFNSDTPPSDIQEYMTEFKAIAQSATATGDRFAPTRWG